MPNEEIKYDADGYVRFEKGWLERAYRRLQIDKALQARNQWLEAPEWVKEQVMNDAAARAEKEPCDHVWGIDGQHSNEYCKKCFISRPPDQPGVDVAGLRKEAQDAIDDREDAAKDYRWGEFGNDGPNPYELIALLDELERLREREKELAIFKDGYRQQLEDTKGQRDALKAKLERVREWAKAYRFPATYEFVTMDTPNEIRTECADDILTILNGGE